MFKGRRKAGCRQLRRALAAAPKAPEMHAAAEYDAYLADECRARPKRMRSLFALPIPWPTPAPQPSGLAA